MFFKKVVLKNLTTSMGKHLCCSPFLINLCRPTASVDYESINRSRVIRVTNNSGVYQSIFLLMK